MALRSLAPPPASLAYLGVGDIPFRKQPCDEIAGAADSRLDPGAGLREAILNRNCLAEASVQLAALRGTGPGWVLDDISARESALDAFRGQAISRLVFSIHGVEPEGLTERVRRYMLARATLAPHKWIRVLLEPFAVLPLVVLTANFLSFLLLAQLPFWMVDWRILSIVGLLMAAVTTLKAIQDTIQGT